MFTDVYPSYLKVQKGFSSSKASQATIVGQVGAVIGGAICGYYSQFIGRRLTVVVACIFGACMIPLWVTPNDWSSITAGTFFIQSAVNGAWGVMPILLNEYAPPQFRGVFPGTVYQLGMARPALDGPSYPLESITHYTASRLPTDMTFHHQATCSVHPPHRFRLSLPATGSDLRQTVRNPITVKSWQLS